ncbi:hypothetical protein SERLA73DRAFT_175605 [Serpula lacrymans var. lacrymans S7.3]|uniref:F-box domain-containing protein n=2 Tax=Serpula lacrymans var. lacrymans TaxID=341189 RepID=F8PKV8_SERL3|nr:uncharacterized protein SERLADRAFT_458139 [Serpula lacrymans var. lacrymans S7.9]EGO03917.1 hypothetical protein SERLA73DRAFT_175605 [Serpula lacrymans var. lacrymans S7.3]EGO29839.1 hypothetical protein SERLADRAFT_458139 [Serpula lacrymans var. lacrymans S7.9]
MTVALLQLPLELLCHALIFLPSRDILRVSVTCKYFKAAVDNSPRLQYILDLAFYQMVSAKSLESGSFISTRSNLLRGREHAWKHMKYKKKCTLPIPQTGHVYEFAGGIYGNATGSLIHFVKLPTAENMQSMRGWTHPTTSWILVDFTFSPADDLLVVVAHPESEEAHAYDIHLRTLSTNEAHPRAASSTLHSINRSLISHEFSEPASAIKVQVVGDFVALLCRDVLLPTYELGASLQIWNWTEKRETKITKTFLDGIDDFSFLSNNAFLVLTVIGIIELYTFPEDLSGPPKCTGRYALPELKQEYIYSCTFMSGNPTPGSGVPCSGGGQLEDGQLFQPDPDKQLLVFFVSIISQSDMEEAQSFIFFVDLVHFFQQNTVTKILLADPELENMPVPWSVWGLEHTRWFPESEATDWQHALYGYKAVETINCDPTNQLSQEPRRLRIRDFNPNVLKDNQRENNSGWKGHIVTGSLVDGTNLPFAEPLGAGLPYREIVSEEKFNVTEVMMDDCRILLLKREAGGELKSIDVLMM